MAPELYEEQVTQSLAKSDVFALGVILINLLTGDYPFNSVYDGSGKTINDVYSQFMRDS